MTQFSLFADSGALFSECRTYRYLLWRGRLDTDLQPFCGMNGSKADEGSTDDHTIRKERSFASQWGAAGILKINLFGFMATDPDDLRKHVGDVVGPSNDDSWRTAFMHCAHRRRPMVVAWGAIHHPQRSSQIERFVALAHEHGVPLMCLGRSKDGSPRHPLMLSYSTSLEAWP